MASETKMNNPFFNAYDRLGVKGKISSNSNFQDLFNNIEEITTKVNTSLSNNESLQIGIKTINEHYKKNIFKIENGDIVISVDIDFLNKLFKLVIDDYLNDNKYKLVLCGCGYLISALLIKRGVHKLNKTLLDSIKNDAINKGISNEEFLELNRSHEKILPIINSIDVLLIAGLTFALGEKLKPNLPAINLKIDNIIRNESNSSFLLPILTLKNKLSKTTKNIVKIIIYIILFIGIFYNLDKILYFIENNFYFIKIIIISIISFLILYLFTTGYIILNYSIRVNKSPDISIENEISLKSYLPKFIKNYLLNLIKISKYKSSQTFVKLYFAGGLLCFIKLIIFFIIIL